MAQKGILVKKDSKIGLKAVFAGDTATGIQKLKDLLDPLNSPSTLVYEEYNDTDQAFIDGTIDPTNTLILE